MYIIIVIGENSLLADILNKKYTIKQNVYIHTT